MQTEWGGVVIPVLLASIGLHGAAQADRAWPLFVPVIGSSSIMYTATVQDIGARQDALTDSDKSRC